MCLAATLAEEPPGRVVKACVAITGPDSHVATPQYHRIASNESWTRIWQEHMGQSWQQRKERIQQRRADADDLREPLALPTIDFDNYMVIGIFQGEGRNCTGLTAVSISEDDRRIVFRYTKESYQTFGPAGSGGGGDKVTAYGLFVLPRSAKPVVVEENAQNILGEPPVWKERITFPEVAPLAGRNGGPAKKPGGVSGDTTRNRRSRQECPGPPNVDRKKGG
jgi:hypothetical protein